MLQNFILLKKFFSILEIKNWKFFTFLIIFIISSLIDILSLGLIAPFILTLINPPELENYKVFSILQKFKIENALYFIGYTIVVIFFIKTFFTIFIRWLIKRFSLRIEKKLQLTLIINYLKMGYEKFSLKNSSEIFRNIKDLPLNSAGCVDMFLRVISEFIILVAILIFLSTVSLKSILFLLAITSLIFFLYQVILKPLNIKLGEQRVEAVRNQYKYIDSGIKGFKEIRIINKENFIVNNLNKFNKMIYKINLKSSLITDTPRYILELFVLFASIVIILNAKSNLSNFSEVIPSIGIFLFAGARILPGSSSIIMGMNTIHNNIKSVETLLQEMEAFEKVSNNIGHNNRTTQENFESIALKDCTFYFKNNKNIILDSIEFSINSKDCIGIVGESGSGKTTIVELIIGLLKPKSGLITFNKKKTDDISKNLFGKVAYITQDPVIIDDSIKTNIVLDRETDKINYDKLNQSLKNANLYRFINNLPYGIETEIGGKKGIRLSGGQNSRLALARAFYHSKEIIVMDEATSALDIENENLILEQIKYMKGKVTLIMISHHKNALKYCDKIYKIANGKIIQ